MRSIFDSDERARILRRLQTLRPNTRARWGRMTASQMVCHLIDAVESSAHPPTGPAGTGVLTHFPIKQLVIYWLPWPKARLQSPPELLVTTPTAWDADLARLTDAIARAAARSPHAPWPHSDVFGPLSGRQWGALLRTHIDHHLRQFGV